MSATDTIDVAALVERLRGEFEYMDAHGLIMGRTVDGLVMREAATALQSQADALAEMRPIGWFIRHDPGCEWKFTNVDPDRMGNVRGWERKRAFIDARALGGSNAE